MSNMTVLEEILDELHYLNSVVQDKYVKCAVQANIVRFQKNLDDERKKNAMNIVEYKIKHLTEKLK